MKEVLLGMKVKVWAFFVAAIVLTVLLSGLYRIVLQMTGGNFTYALDDAYIHMSIARNLALHGVWGVTSEAFSSSSSSPFWSLLLAGGFALIGPAHDLSLWLNIFFSFVLLWVARGVCRRRGLTERETLMVLVSLIFFVPLMPLVFSGMEHVLQIVLSVLFVDLATRLGGHPTEGSEAPHLSLVIAVGMLLCAVRYEGMFLVLAVAILLAFRGQACLALIVSGFCHCHGRMGRMGAWVGAWGAWAWAHGVGPRQPNDLMKKKYGKWAIF